MSKILFVSNINSYDEKLVQELFNQSFLNYSKIVFFVGNVTDPSLLSKFKELFNEILYSSLKKEIPATYEEIKEKDLLSYPIGNDKTVYDNCLKIQEMLTKISSDFHEISIVGLLEEIIIHQDPFTFIFALHQKCRALIEENLPDLSNLTTNTISRFVKDRKCLVKVIENNSNENDSNYFNKISEKIDYIFNEANVFETDDEVFITLPFNFIKIPKLNKKQKQKKIIFVISPEYPINKIVKILFLKPSAIVVCNSSSPDYKIGKTPVYCLSPGTFCFIEF